MTDIPIDNMLADFGIAHSEHQSARSMLFEWGVIQRSPHRANIARHKVGDAREVLETAFLWHCNNGECRQAAREDTGSGREDDLPRLLVAQSSCRICGGDPSASVLGQAGQALTGAGIDRILVVGGTEAKEREIRQKSPPELEWRFVDGKRCATTAITSPIGTGRRSSSSGKARRWITRFRTTLTARGTRG